MENGPKIHPLGDLVDEKQGCLSKQTPSFKPGLSQWLAIYY
jgi:hypothetical protein